MAWMASPAVMGAICCPDYWEEPAPAHECLIINYYGLYATSRG